MDALRTGSLMAASYMQVQWIPFIDGEEAHPGSHPGDKTFARQIDPGGQNHDREKHLDLVDWSNALAARSGAASQR